jgi:hypothetical protein
MNGYSALASEIATPVSTREMSLFSSQLEYEGAKIVLCGWKENA